MAQVHTDSSIVSSRGYLLPKAQVPMAQGHKFAQIFEVWMSK